MKISPSPIRYNIQNSTSSKPLQTQGKQIQQYLGESHLCGLDALSNYNLAFARKKTAIYAINTETGKRKRFDTQSKAADKLNIRQPCISRAVNNDDGYGKAGKYIFIDASIVETIDKNGKRHPRKAKINKIIQQFTPTSEAYYAVNKDDPDDYMFFNSRDEALQGLKTTPANFKKHVSGKTKNIMGRIIIPADKVESIDKNGEKILDKQQIVQKKKKKKPETQANPLYIYNTDRELVPYLNQAQAAKSLGRTKQAISERLKRGHLNVDGNILIKARDIEYTNKNGKIEIDHEKLKRILEEYLPPHKIKLIDISEIIQPLKAEA